jgi:hypothetical protein
VRASAAPARDHGVPTQATVKAIRRVDDVVRMQASEGHRVTANVYGMG